MSVILITNCTATQSISASADLEGQNLPRDLTVLEARDEWKKHLDAEPPSISPLKLYRGIAFNSVVKAQNYVGAENIYIVSIGQGLVNLAEKITPYDLSIDPDHKNSLTKVVTQEAFSPAYWWSLINESKGGSTSPIAELAKYDEIDLIVIAVTNRFLPLIIEDLVNTGTSMEGMDKLRIITTSTVSMSTKLAPYTLLYDKRINIGTVGNRNDMTQRAALNFLGLYKENADAVGAPIEMHRQMIDTELAKYGNEPLSRKEEQEKTVERISGWLKGGKFDGRSPDTVYMDYKTKFEPNVSVTAFRKAWRQTFAPPKSPKTKKSDGATANAAVKALSFISHKLNKPVGGAASWEQEEAALDALRVFVGVVRDAQPDARFTSAEVFAWAQQYFSELDTQAPPQMTSVNKLAQILKNYHEEVGIAIAITGSSAGGGTVYMLSTLEGDS